LTPASGYGGFGNGQMLVPLLAGAALLVPGRKS
jgi:hypothetical protein